MEVLEKIRLTITKLEAQKYALQNTIDDLRSIEQKLSKGKPKQKQKPEIVNRYLERLHRRINKKHNSNQTYE